MKRFVIALIIFGALHSNIAFGAGVANLKKKFEAPRAEGQRAPAVPAVAQPTAPRVAAGAAPAVAREGGSTELEVTRKALENAQTLLTSIYQELRAPAILGGLRQPAAKDMRDKINSALDSLYWTQADTALRDAWYFLQDGIEGHTPILPGDANPWEGWSERAWTKKEEIISSSQHGQGTIWEINPEFGEFLVNYMRDYDNLKTFAKRMQLVENVGRVVPSLYGHGPTLSKQTLQKAIGEVIKVAPATGKILHGKFMQRMS